MTLWPIFCLLAGIFLISDRLSAEKPEDTRGLLSLTGLQRHDIVLGNLSFR